MTLNQRIKNARHKTNADASEQIALAAVADANGDLCKADDVLFTIWRETGDARIDDARKLIAQQAREAFEKAQAHAWHVRQHRNDCCDCGESI